jgi:excisionase family DNA binding protein
MQEPTFHTVHEAAQILRVDAATIYRSIREGSFPAVRIRSRYVIPAAALRQVAATAVNNGTCVDITDSAVPADASRNADWHRPCRYVRGDG